MRYWEVKKPGDPKVYLAKNRRNQANHKYHKYLDTKGVRLSRIFLLFCYLKIFNDPIPYSFWKNQKKKKNSQFSHFAKINNVERSEVLLQSSYSNLSPPAPILKSPMAPPSQLLAITELNSFFLHLSLPNNYLTISYMKYRTILPTCL